MKMEGSTLRGVAACCVVLLAVMVVSTQSAPSHRPIRRAVSEATSQADMGVTRTCHGNTICKWEVYIPFSRRVDYVMKNTCECPKEKQCVRTDDDLSVSAYVHRCRSPQIS